MKSGHHLVIIDKEPCEGDSLRAACGNLYSNLEIIVSDVLSDDINDIYSSGDAIIFALPESACLDVLASKAHLMKDEVKIINTCSIQSSFLSMRKPFYRITLW